MHTAAIAAGSARHIPAALFPSNVSQRANSLAEDVAPAAGVLVSTNHYLPHFTTCHLPDYFLLNLFHDQRTKNFKMEMHVLFCGYNNLGIGIQYVYTLYLYTTTSLYRLCQQTHL